MAVRVECNSFVGENERERGNAFFKGAIRIGLVWSQVDDSPPGFGARGDHCTSSDLADIVPGTDRLLLNWGLIRMDFCV